MAAEKVGASARSVPPSQVLQAYGLQGAPVPLMGGQGASWLVGQAVLKPLDVDPAQVQWQGALLTRLSVEADFRVSVPLRTRAGTWTAHGWAAWRYEPGAHAPGRWHEIIAVGQHLHAALEREPEPAFLSARTDRWAIADRIAWGELPAAGHAVTHSLETLFAALRPLHLRRQLVHGDLTGNVLFHPDKPPLIIDLSAYWRPPAFASAVVVVVADAMVYDGAGQETVEPLLQEPGFLQCLLRALIFRAVTDQLARPPRSTSAPDPYWPATQVATRLIRRA